MGFEGSKVYCYGIPNGCLWNTGCKTDDDCKKKYSTSSLKYNGATVTTCEKNLPTGWPSEACKCEGNVFVILLEDRLFIVNDGDNRNFAAIFLCVNTIFFNIVQESTM